MTMKEIKNEHHMSTQNISDFEHNYLECFFDVLYSQSSNNKNDLAK